MTKTKKYSSEDLSFSKEDIKTILECILFSSSVDVCASWYKEDTDKMLELAERLRMDHTDIPIENVYISRFEDEEHPFMDEQTQRIVDAFPEIEKIEKFNL